eukprot:5150554-Lingulodinium_polyedra.AAC.1
MRVDAHVVGEGARDGSGTPNRADPGPREEGNQHHAKGAALGDSAAVAFYGTEPIGQAKAQPEAIR